MTGARTNAGASALFEGLEHDNNVYYVLNVTGVRALSGASLVFGNASLYSEIGKARLGTTTMVEGKKFWKVWLCHLVPFRCC